MKRFVQATAALLVAFGAGEARAQCQAGALACDPYAIEAWLTMGPTLSPLVRLQNRSGGLDVSPLLRIGALAGLPVQVEMALSRGFSEQEPIQVQAGVRVLPVAITPTGVTRGGLPGHNPGIIAGVGTVGWYAGIVYEYLFVPEAGLVAEVQWTFGGVLVAPPSLHLGAKFQFPAFSY